MKSVMFIDLVSYFDKAVPFLPGEPGTARPFLGPLSLPVVLRGLCFDSQRLETGIGSGRCFYAEGNERVVDITSGE